MIFLGIETSCDETAISLFDTSKGILSSIISSQADIHALYGGVVPELASRNHALKIEPVYKKALKDADVKSEDIDAIGVTRAPGLIGSLFVGVAFAKGLAYALKIPVIPVNHIAAHAIAAEINHPELRPPYAALVISGGHSHLYYVDKSYNFKLYSHTVDDAAGEAFDKVAKMMDLPYPGGPEIEKLALKGDPEKITFTVAMRNQKNMSFSGLKTAVLNQIKNNNSITKGDVAASFQETLVKTLIEKSENCINYFKIDKLVVAGGVACNGYLRDEFYHYFKNRCNIYFPTKYHCTDNGDMVAFAASKFYRLRNFMGYNSNAKDNEPRINSI